MFVGRGSLLAQIHKAVAQEQGRYDLQGGHGAGKTSIVRRLDEAAPGFHPIVVNLEDFNPGHRGESGESASVGAVQSSFRRFSALLQHLVRQTARDDVADRFEHEVTEAHNAEVAGRRVYSLEQAMVETVGGLTPKDLADAWRASASAVADRFVAHWNEPGNGKRRLLLLDNVDEVADQELGRWLGKLLHELHRTTVVVTRQPEGPFPPTATTESGYGFQTIEIPDFSEEEVRDYLNDKGPERVADDLVGKVHRITGGHPGTVAVVQKLLWGTGVGGAADPEEVLRDLPEDAGERVALLVERLVKRPDDPAMSRALWAAAVPRRFDAPLLKALLADLAVSDEDRERLFDAFSRFPFVEDVTLPEGPLPARSVLRIHPYVRYGLLDRMVRLDRERFSALHDRSAEYHNRLLLKGPTGAAYNYGDAYVYEDPEWQGSKREWLHHRGHATTKAARREAVLECTRVFLEAFWWWGNYVHFDFCDQLVADLAHMTEPHGAVEASTWSDLGVLHDSLRAFLHAYPPRSGKRDDAAWNEVNDALLRIQGVCGLQHRGKEGTDEERKVAALLDVFLAHTWRYRDRHAPHADRYYRRAANGFNTVDEVWSAAWVQFERADLRFERGEVDDELRRQWEAAAGIVQPRLSDDGGAADEGEDAGDEEPDEELAANLHRLRGDVCWVEARHERATQWYRRAVLHSYLFHLVGGPPDEYTLQFYVDVRARVLNRLSELWNTHREDLAVTCAEELARVCIDTSFGETPPDRAELHALLADARPVALAHALFPPGPEVSDLGERTSPFLDEHLRRQEPLDRDALAMDLHDENWP